jgi:hypothetical protein
LAAFGRLLRCGLLHVIDSYDEIDSWNFQLAAGGPAGAAVV